MTVSLGTEVGGPLDWMLSSGGSTVRPTVHDTTHGRGESNPLPLSGRRIVSPLGRPSSGEREVGRGSGRSWTFSPVELGFGLSGCERPDEVRVRQGTSREV